MSKNNSIFLSAFRENISEFIQERWHDSAPISYYGHLYYSISLSMTPFLGDEGRHFHMERTKDSIVAVVVVASAALLFLGTAMRLCQLSKLTCFWQSYSESDLKNLSEDSDRMAKIGKITKSVQNLLWREFKEAMIDVTFAIGIILAIGIVVVGAAASTHTLIVIGAVGAVGIAACRISKLVYNEMYLSQDIRGIREEYNNLGVW